MVLQAYARAWYARMLRAAPSTPSPRNGPVVRVGEGAADRVLILGNGPLHGWGVLQRELSVPGQLARLLHARTGRATVTEYVGDERMNAASASAWLGEAIGHRHDVAVIAIGMNDSLRLSGLAKWRGSMRRLVGQVLEESDPDTAILLVGLPGVRNYVMADSWMGGVAERRAREMTAVLREIAETETRVAFAAAPVEQFELDRPIGSGPMYAAWAEGLVDDIVLRLDAVRAARPPLEAPDRRWEWAGAAEAIDRSETGVVSARLEGIVEQVQQRFGVALAAVNLLEGDRTFFIAGGAGAPRSMPRALAYCDTTVREDVPLVVLNRADDPRFRENAFLDVVGLPFYAGVPLHASDGHAVATLCILDSAPRTAFDVEDLQRFALDAESELQALEPAVRPSVSQSAQDER